MRGPKPPAVNLTDENDKVLSNWSDGIVHLSNWPCAAGLCWPLQTARTMPRSLGSWAGIAVDSSAVARPVVGATADLPGRLDDCRTAEDLPRPGTPARITAEQRCQIEAMACEEPEDSGRPISQWTSREIADEVMKRGIVDSISPATARL